MSIEFGLGRFGDRRLEKGGRVARCPGRAAWLSDPAACGMSGTGDAVLALFA